MGLLRCCVTVNVPWEYLQNRNMFHGEENKSTNLIYSLTYL